MFSAVANPDGEDGVLSADGGAAAGGVVGVEDEILARFYFAGFGQAEDNLGFVVGDGVAADGDEVSVGGDAGAVDGAGGEEPVVGVDERGRGPAGGGAAGEGDVADFLRRTTSGR